MLEALQEWLVRVGELGLPITFRLRGGGTSLQGGGEVRGAVLVFFENGPFGGPTDIVIAEIDPDSAACWVGGRDGGWQDWTKPLPTPQDAETDAPSDGG